MKSYQHSQTFNVLKRTKEVIKDNLTSAQYLHTLDMFIWNALEPIAQECPDFFNNYIAKCVAHQALHPNSKYTSDDKAKLPIMLFNSLRAETPSKKIFMAKKLYLNRGLLLGAISLFLNEVKEYKTLQSAFTDVKNFSVLRTRLVAIETRIGIITPSNLYSTIQQVEYWDEKARRWKSMIVEKYTRMAVVSAQRTYVDFNHYVELGDVSQIYMMVMSKAIDRCDARLGVLTTFIQSWLKTARAQVATMANRQTDESLEAMAETLGDSMALGANLPDTSLEAIQEVAYRASIADKDGLVRTSLGIPQYINAKHKQTLLNFSLE